ncbi:LCP family protein [Actinomadura macrotermitis]|uniref:Cell wall biosynthesis protein LcpA n=1 Tax=Actinomadura macrotermitis TaxID=2585200 RepID=A0A7K0C4B2_9ACTN|nr:LCP family protein [Actinomadura macrotermitis]MQY08289.1 Cell wall biosynthesis protein LcpA [Actinomadura macrotermitis]
MRPKGPLAWLAIAVAALLVTGSLSAYGYYWNLQSSIGHEDSDRLLGKDRPKKLNGALNILMLGSDSRKGANAKYGRGYRNKVPASDTMIVLHLSPGGRQAMGITFPRDLMAPIPSCTREDGTRSASSTLAMLNEAIGRAGPSCTMKTIEKLSGIHLDHFVQLDFVGFKGITKAVGGVWVCLPNDVNDRKSGLHMSQGRHRVQGEDALAYVRSRTGFGDGSDTQRIKRQQRFLGSLANQAMSGGVLANPARLNALLSASAKSLTTDRALSVGDMLKIAQSMRGLTAGKLRFVTVPSRPWSRDANRVELTEAAAPFFEAVREDRTVPAPAPKPTVPPGKVRVYNATAAAGQARTTAAALKSRGYTVVKVGTLTRPAPTQIRYGSGARQQAEELAKLVPGAAVKPRKGGAPDVVDLVIGAGFPQLKDASGGIPHLQGETRASDDICDKGQA